MPSDSADKEAQLKALFAQSKSLKALYDEALTTLTAVDRIDSASPRTDTEVEKNRARSDSLRSDYLNEIRPLIIAETSRVNGDPLVVLNEIDRQRTLRKQAIENPVFLL